MSTDKNRQIILKVTRLNRVAAQQMLLDMGYRWPSTGSVILDKKMKYIRLQSNKAVSHGDIMEVSRDCPNRIKFVSKAKTKKEIENLLILFALSS